MKTIGLIGGLGSESTVDYYKSIIHESTGGRPEPDYPEIIIYNVNMTEVMAMVSGGRLGELTDFLLGKIGALHRAGVELGAIASNTPHIVFDAVAA
jgi:aspartate racemase